MPAVAPDGAPAMAAPSSPVEGAVHVWRVDLETGPAVVAAGADEQRRAGRMRDERHRARFLASRAWLRVVLGLYLDVEPGAVRFDLGGRGKPSVVDGGGLRFSLSRSAAVALIAVTRERAVGVDIERIRDDLDHGRLARQHFSADEADALVALPEPLRRDAFFDLWVRKEAVVKASGAGLGDGLSHLDVRHDLVAGRWSVTSVDAGSGFAAAVAVDGVMGPLTTRSLPAGDPLRG